MKGWIEKTHKCLVQNDCAHLDILQFSSGEAFMERAQMIAVERHVVHGKTDLVDSPFDFDVTEALIVNVDDPYG